jgi:hypothetical protein
MQKESLVIIYTPLQYLNALAYKNQLGKKCKFLVLTSRKINIQQIRKIDKENNCNYPLKKICFFNEELLWISKSLYTLFLRTSKYKEIIIGNYDNIISYFLALKFQGKNKEIILLDDGLATLNVYRERNELKILKSSCLFGGKINLLINNILFKKNYLNSITFYTSFDLQSIAAPRFDKVIKQVYEVIDNQNKIINEIWFIGSPLLENNTISEEKFEECMNKVKSYANENELSFKYILHRFEKPKVGLNCIQFDSPIEIVIKDSNLFPKEVISFYSTALINIANIFPQIKCTYINLYKINGNLHALKYVYEAFEKHNNLKEFSIKQE